VPHLRGSCLCGAVRYSCSAKPLFTVVCHCADCQKQTGTAFSIVVGVPEDAFEVDGELSVYTTVGEATRQATHRHFCAKCGSPVVSVLDASPEVAFIKAGTLEDRSWLDPETHVWRRSAQPWVAADERPAFETSSSG
jgi:hypothetical protein